MFTKRNQTLTKSWNALGDMRNQIKDRVKQMMGWAGDATFYDRIYGRVECTLAEQQAFKTAFAQIVLQTFQQFNEIDLFPADDFKRATVE